MILFHDIYLLNVLNDMKRVLFLKGLCLLIVPFPRTNFMKNSFSHSGAILWNSLPCDMREAKSLSQFIGLAHLNFRFFKYCIHGIHDKQVLVWLVVDGFCILFRVVRFI